MACLNKLQNKLNLINLWHLIWIIVVISEILTAMMSIILRGTVTRDYLITGGVVSLIAAIVFVYIIHRSWEIEKKAEVELKKYAQELRLEITERKKVEKQITASLKEKEMLLQEIHHRVKNNLQVISSLLNLQSGYVKDHQTLEIFQDSQNRVRSMALIHEKLYRSANLAQINFAEYLQDLVSYLFRVHSANARGIRLNIQTDATFLGIDAAVPCGLILNELISNSLKHAFADGQPGEVQIELRPAGDNEIILIVGDNGIGFPPELDFRTTESLGLQLVNTLVSQLDGTINLERTPGTQFKIRFAHS